MESGVCVGGLALDEILGFSVGGSDYSWGFGGVNGVGLWLRALRLVGGLDGSGWFGAVGGVGILAGSGWV